MKPFRNYLQSIIIMTRRQGKTIAVLVFVLIFMPYLLKNSISGHRVTRMKPVQLQEQLEQVSPAELEEKGNLLIQSSTTLPPLPLCPLVSPLLIGWLRVRLSAPSLEEIGWKNNLLSPGGHYAPADCLSRSRVAIIVPYRDRETHLRLFLHNLIPVLKRQQLEFNIFVIEQGGPSKNESFNRAMLFNVGFVEANKMYPHWQCYIFHDVDLIPENDHNLYDCPTQPRHMTVALDRWNYALPYNAIFGGVAAFPKLHFLKVNGFSNVFWGWGGEDDDMYERTRYYRLQVIRPPASVAKYRSLSHSPQEKFEERLNLLAKARQRVKSDGLSNLNYTVEQVTLEKTHTLIRVRLFRVGREASRRNRTRTTAMVHKNTTSFDLPPSRLNQSDSDQI